MEKRALIAVALSFLILFAYQYFFVKPEPQPPQVQKPAPTATVQKNIEPAPEVKPKTLLDVQTNKLPSEEKEITVETDLYSAVFSNKGATIKHFELKKYKDSKGNNVFLLKTTGEIPALGIGSKEEFELTNAFFSSTAKNIKLDNNKKSDSLTFEYASSGLSVRRTFTFYNDSYKIDIKDELSGPSEYWITIGTDFGIHDKNDASAHSGPVLLKDDADRLEFSLKNLNEPKTLKGQIKWIAQEDKYFFASIVPLNPMDEARVWKTKDSPVIALKGKAGTNNFMLYAGPKEYDTLKALNRGLEHVIDFGFFSILAVPLFWVLKMLYKIAGNYGWAIVLLTIIVRIPFIPLINKSQKSMKKLQEIQPRMAEIREKYKKDPQRMQREMMEIYKTHKVNPLGGCLPILLQIPVFFALYKILLISIELRGAPYIFWIKDLSAPDTLFGHLPAWLPLIGGFAVGPLPILMGATMLIQQKMTPTSMDPMQNKLMMFMPVIFTFLFLNFASGLVLYWLVNNIFSISQQVYVNQKMAKESAS